jgi:hypothetical protein
VPTANLLYNPSQFSVPYNGSQCPAGSRVSWVDVGLEALTPSSGGTNTSITIAVQVGNSTSTYAPGVPVVVGTLSGPPSNQSTSWINFPLSPVLTTISPQAESEPYLNVTFMLKPTTDQFAAPTIVNWRARFDCKPSE